MRIAIFSAHQFDKDFLSAANQSYGYELVYFDTKLNLQTVALARGFFAIGCFVTDHLSAAVLQQLAAGDTKLIALRSAGFNHIDVAAAKKLGMTVARVPAYSPYAVAEFAIGMVLSLNRKIHRAYQRVREQNFSLDGLLGFDLHGKTVGVIGTGKIGSIFASIMQGFGCQLLAYDIQPNSLCIEQGVQYVSLTTLYAQADIISLHCPLTPQTQHLINGAALAQMKMGVMLINTGRGALLDTAAVIQALKTGKIGYLGIDVYEEEEKLFFTDLSETVIQDDIFARLLTFPNVLITGHQAFFTHTALENIAQTTLANIHGFIEGDMPAENLL